MTGLSLDPADDHFVLRSEKPDGTTATISLSTEEVVTLATMGPTLLEIVALKDHSLQNRSSLTPIAAMDVFDFQLRLEVLETKILLLFRLGISGSSTAAYALSPTVAERLAQDIPPYLESLRGKSPTKQ